MRLLLVLLLGFGFALAQSSLEQMRDNINDGYYAVAAQVLGPQLIREAQYQNDPEAHYLYAQALRLTGDIEGARAALNQAVSLAESPDARFRHLDALLYAAENDASQALDILEETFEESPSYALAMDWGRIAWQSGRIEEALAAFTRASRTPQGQKELWPELNRGRILLSQEEYALAIAALNKAIDIFVANDVAVGDLPSIGYIEAFYLLGRSYEALGDFANARVNYQSARDISGNYPPAEEALARLGN